MVHVRRARALARHDSVVAVVPTPWAPRPAAALSERWAAYARRPRHAHLDGVLVLRPRYLQVPGSGPWAGVAMALGAVRCIRRLRARGRCDVLFAQGILPDGLAAVLLGRWTHTPVACLGRGTDVHGLPRSGLARRLAIFTMDRADGIAVVARALGRTLTHVAGARPITLLPNGIDLECFVPGDRAEARRRLGIEPRARLVLYVGRLAERKGIEELVDALARIAPAEPDVALALVGDGPLRAALVERATALGLAARIRFAGEVSHREVVPWMQACDVLALPSAAEGFPNVVREALACGRPVVATPVGDLPEVVDAGAGHLVPIGDLRALADALAATLQSSWDEAALRRRVAGMSWDANGRATHRFLQEVRAT